MDAAERAELDGLRRRAYGPEVAVRDGLADEELARLIELEDLARAAQEASRSAAAASAPAPFADDPASRREPSPRGGRRGARSGRSGRRTVAVAVVAVVVVGAAVAASVLLQHSVTPDAGPGTPSPSTVVELMPIREAYTLARARDAVVLVNLSIEEASRTSAPVDETLVFPDFPSGGPVRWAQPLGEQFGWMLWVGGADGALQPEHCILVERDGRALSRCVPAVLRAQSALAVAVPWEDIPSGLRPLGMRSDQRIGFWWQTDDTVTVRLADDSPLPTPSPSLALP